MPSQKIKPVQKSAPGLIEHMHEGVYNFCCTDSTEIFFSKLRSAGLNYNLPSFLTDSYWGVGVSYKRCLLTFFIFFCNHSIS